MFYLIYRLEIENFFCFRDRQVLDLTVPRSVPDEQDGRLMPIFHGSELRMPKVVVAFGANGSGKSTVLKAVTFLLGFMADSFRNDQFCAAHSWPFNEAKSMKWPIRLAMECGGAMTLSREALRKAREEPQTVLHGTYRYEIVLAPVGKSGTREVLSETLKQRVAGKGKWMRTFERDGQGRVVGSKNFPLSGYAKIANNLPSYASLISTLAGLQHEPSQTLVDFLRRGCATNILFDKAIPLSSEIAKVLESKPKILKALNKKIREIDLGVEEVAVREQMGGLAMLFKHTGLEVEMQWFSESTGTRSFIQEFPFLYLPIMAGGGIAVVDEPDSAVHPLVLTDMMNWYRVPEGDFKSGVQLWMSCQNPVLMDDLTKEEIVFCEKRLDGSSEVFSLASIKGVRRDDNYLKKYLSGIYGAVPQCG